MNYHDIRFLSVWFNLFSLLLDVGLTSVMVHNGYYELNRFIIYAFGSPLMWLNVNLWLFMLLWVCVESCAGFYADSWLGKYCYYLWGVSGLVKLFPVVLNVVTIVSVK